MGFSLTPHCRYTPSLVVGVLGVTLFVIGLVAHLYLLLRHRTWYFSTVVVGTVMEIVGYAFRILSSQQNPYSVPWFVVQVWSANSTKMRIALLTSIVLLHRGRPRLLLRGDLYSRFGHDQSRLRKTVRSPAAEAHPLDFYCLRCGCNRRPDSRRSTGRRSILEPQRPNNIQQHSPGWLGFPSLLIRDVPDRFVLDIVQGEEELSHD